MKKGIVIFLCLLFCVFTYSQNRKIKVAVATNMDTTFTVLGPYGTRTFDVNLSKELFGYINSIIDTNLFDLHQVALPYYIISNTDNNVDFPKKSAIVKWLSELRKSKSYDMMLYLYKPIIDKTAHSGLNGFSYGMTTSGNKVFSLNDAYVFDTKDAAELAHVSLYSDSEYVTRLDSADRFSKSLIKYNINDIAKAKELIIELNKGFALRVCQNMMLAVRKYKNNTQQ